MDYLYDEQEVGPNRLRMEIFKCAMEDYMAALQGIRRVPGVCSRNKRGDFEIIKYDCEQFFRSAWFKLLFDLDIDGEEIIKGIQKRVVAGDYKTRKLKVKTIRQYELAAKRKEMAN